MSRFRRITDCPGTSEPRASRNVGHRSILGNAGGTPALRGQVVPVRQWALVFVGLLCLGLAGCPTMGRPNWCNPGTAPEQQLRAQQFDPYAQPDLGPEIDGVRPRGFEQPPTNPPRLPLR